MDLAQLRRSLTSFRLDPKKREDLTVAVKQLRSELRSHHRDRHHGHHHGRCGSRGGMREFRAMKQEMLATKREFKAAIKAVKAEKKAQRKERKGRKKEMKEAHRQKKRERKKEIKLGKKKIIGEEVRAWMVTEPEQEPQRDVQVTVNRGVDVDRGLWRGDQGQVVGVAPVVDVEGAKE